MLARTFRIIHNLNNLSKHASQNVLDKLHKLAASRTLKNMLLLGRTH